MAQAVKRLYPKAKLAIGPSIEDGFYYDFDVEKPFSEEELGRIEKEMEKVIKENHKFERSDIPKKEARELFKKLDEPYKLELIDEIPDDKVTIYKDGDFLDLCRGPHIEKTGQVKAYKLLSVAGAYWRGSEKNKMLQRIYGTAFETKDELDKYLHLLEEAKKRDHRKLGKELDLFTIQDEIGAGLVLWHPKGALTRKVIEDFWKEEHLKKGYEIINIPHIARMDLWKTSGHLEFYKDYMYSPIDIEGQNYMLKPMNCPGHIVIYKTRTRSYRDLPIRWAELGTVYRYEKSGVLHGLMRVRGFTQDDAHIFCTPEQLEGELTNVIELARYMLGRFGFKEYEVYHSTMPEKHVGSLEHWEMAKDAITKALDKSGLKYKVDPGEGVFYGPKIDIKIKDSLGRPWQCSTIQVDFNLPERFGITYVGEDGKEHTPIMVHRALLGSLERFFGVLIEHYAGEFPLWLAPVQGMVVPVSAKCSDYAKKIEGEFKKAGLRVECDMRNERLNAKIRDAEMQKILYMFIVGEKEANSDSVSIRSKEKGDEGIVKYTEAIKRLIEERG